MKNKKWFGLERNVFILGLVSLFNDFSGEMVLAVFPAFFTSVLRSGAASLGLVEGVAEGASNIIKIFSGKISDKTNNRKIFILSGYTLSVLTRPFYSFSNKVFEVFSLRVTDRVGKGLRDAPRDAFISLSSPKEEVGRSFGYHRTMDTIGAILGPLTAFFILQRFPQKFNYVFMTSFVIGLFAIASIFLVQEIKGIFLGKDIKLETLNKFSKKFKLYLVSLFILSIGSLPIAVLLLKTTESNLPISYIPLFYMIYNLSYALFSISAGKKSDIIGSQKVILYGYLILIAGYFFLNISSSTIALILTFFLLGLFPALTDGVQRSYAAHLTIEERRGGAYGLLNATIGIGLMISGIAGGYIWQHYGSSASLEISSIALLLGLGLFFINSRSLDPKSLI